MMEEAVGKRLRSLPSVEELLSDPAAVALIQQHGRKRAVEAVRAAIEEERGAILAGAAEAECAVDDGAAGRAVLAAGLLLRVGELLEHWSRPGLRRVLNLSGVVIHTNLGRSRMAGSAIAHVTEVAGSYSNLEYDLEAGTRGHRETSIEALLTRLTGAEAGFAVNNNAAAVLLLLMALAPGREVLVSRGQLVEIGGSFRLPDIMRAGGVHLVEVGTTNRTRIGDYEAAITEQTALLLWVHTSNYRIVGFTQETELAELVGLSRRRGVPVAADLGSGALVESGPLAGLFADEPGVGAALRAGVDVVCFSGDKLLGGPQAGILLGRTGIVGRLRDHPVARALRLDKMSLAALEATLQMYADPEQAIREIPTLRMLRRTSAETAALAERLRAEVEALDVTALTLEVEPSVGRVGGGALPEAELPSHALRVSIVEVPGGGAGPLGRVSAAALETELRRAPLPVVARVAQGSLLLDVLALDETEVGEAAASLAWAVGRLTGSSGGAGAGGRAEPAAADS